jgi:hypothetical protein
LMIEFQNELHWYHISKYQKLSENFIRANQEKVDWSAIVSHQLLSEDFLCEFHKRIPWAYYFRSKNATFPIIKKFLLKTKFKNVEEILCDHLTNKQKLEVQKILNIKHIFETPIF